MFSTDARFVFLLIERMAAKLGSLLQGSLGLSSPNAELCREGPRVLRLLPSAFPGRTEHPHSLAVCFLASPATGQDGVHALSVLIYKRVRESPQKVHGSDGYFEALCKCTGLSPQCPVLEPSGYEVQPLCLHRSGNQMLPVHGDCCLEYLDC